MVGFLCLNPSHFYLGLAISQMYTIVFNEKSLMIFKNKNLYMASILNSNDTNDYVLVEAKAPLKSYSNDIKHSNQKIIEV